MLFKYVQLIVCQSYLSKAGEKILPYRKPQSCRVSAQCCALVTVVSCVVFTA